MSSTLALAAAVAAAVLGAPLGAQAYEVVALGVTGAITGKVMYEGPPTTKKKIILTKDKEVCGSGVREIDEILLAPDNAVQQGIVYLKDVSKGKDWEQPLKTAAIENRSCDFQPRVQIVRAGEIEIVNADPILHNTHGFLDKRTVFNIALPHQGLRIKKALRIPGILRVECDAHGWMLGWIYVADNPYYATTDKDGTFTLSGVPPGTYTLVTWHSYTGAVERTVSVRANEATSVTIELRK